MRELEFLPTWYPRLRRRQQFLKLQGAITVALVVLLGGWMINARAGVSKQTQARAALDNELSKSSAELALLNEQVDLKGQLQKQKEIMDRVGKHVESSRLISLLSDSLTKQMAVLELKFSTIESAPRVNRDPTIREEAPPERRLQVSVVGVAPSDLDISEFLDRLSKVRFCESVQLLEANDMAKDGHLLRRFEVVFSVNLTRGAATW